MPAGEPFTSRQTQELSRAVRLARERSGLDFSLFVGRVEDALDGGEPRRAAERLHAALGERAPGAVLVVVDPAVRRIEVVTGARARLRLDDRSCALAALSMSSAFAGGDLTGGIVNGLRQLADAVTVLSES